jgi:predicted nuclease of restriction endonuclease-like RecB superfamily
VFGPRTRHGDRFARAVLELMRAFPELEGTARVLVNEREYVLRLPRGLAEAISRIPAAADGAPEERDVADAEQPVAVVRSADDGTRFDSAVERHLYQTLRGMERKGDTRGWLVEREPEPIVHGPTVLVPDFALTRKTFDPAAQDETRVFVEVIGFWTPAYRERKKAKLLELGGLVDMVLVVQDTLAPDFESLPYSVLPYKRRPSAYDLIMLLEREYPAAPTPGRPRVRTPVLPDESVRREWEALFGSPATASPSPAARNTPAVG